MIESNKYLTIHSGIWNLKNLTLAQKCVLAVIDNNSGSGCCYAKNDTLSSMLNISTRNFQKHLDTLSLKGFINIDYDNPSNNHGRKMYVTIDDGISLGVNNCSHGGEQQYVPRGEQQYVQNNNSLQEVNNKEKHMKPKGFEEFWVAYPKKKNKQQAIKAFKAQRINGELRTILDDIQELKNTNDWMREGGQFIPYPSSYLNGRRWEDERDKTTGEPF